MIKPRQAARQRLCGRTQPLIVLSARNTSFNTLNALYEHFLCAGPLVGLLLHHCDVGAVDFTGQIIVAFLYMNISDTSLIHLAFLQI